ncbi:MAG: BBP7 family outer membrane beta-barrel protein [Planctomycetes bacterium]|nr:BBP7 family outer membrane beta-barrel protein [Planctomycetota bacterium]
MHFSWFRARGVMAVSAAVMALQGMVLQGGPAFAQFVPYTGGPTQGYSPYQQQTQYQQQTPYQQQAQPQYGAQPRYAQPQYTAMAYQGSGTRAAAPTLNQPVEPIAPGPAVQSAPMQNYSAAPAPAPMAYDNYSSGGCATGSCGVYNTFEGGGCGVGSGCGVGGTFGGCDTGCGAGGGFLGNGLGSRRGGRRWFGGFYGLYMERDGNPWKGLAFSTPVASATGYYPMDSEFVLNRTDLDNDTFAGAEVRFGSTLGQCGNYGWEAVYWGLVEDEQSVMITDLAADANRLYTMINQAGIQYDADGAGAGVNRWANDYFDYAPPVANPVGLDTIRIRQVTARNNFSMQNIELNFLRMSLLGGGYYSSPSTSGAYYGGGLGGRGLGGRALGRGGRGGNGASGCASGGCDVGGCDSCAGGSACGGGCASRYSLTGVLGVRYLRVDEDFLFRTDYDNETQATTGFLSRNVDVDNHLVGAQFGVNGIYRLGCSGRWALNLNSVFGVYGNRMEVWNRMDAPTGGVVTAADGSTFDYRYEDNDVAFVGELRAGTSYQYSRNWRLYGGYRLLGIGGVALAFDQIAQQNVTAAQIQHVDSDGSIFIHGLQGGVEFTY